MKILRNLEPILNKKQFNIRDLAQVIQRETQTVRMWEKNGFISEADMRAENNWRVYSVNHFIEVLEQILNREWKRKVIKNEKEVKYFIEELKNRNKE